MFVECSVLISLIRKIFGVQYTYKQLPYFLQMYSTAAMDGVMSEVLVSIKFINQSSKSISKLELNLPDSDSLKMVRIVSTCGSPLSVISSDCSRLWEPWT